MRRRGVLVTGASGFIGGHLCEALLADGHEVAGLVRRGSDTAHLRRIGVRLCLGDITDPASLGRACIGADWVFHTAAVVGTFGPWAHFRAVGVEGTRNVVEAAAAAGASRLIHVSSVAYYGTRPEGRVYSERTPADAAPEPWNHYVREKILSEQVVWQAHQEGRVRATVVRPSIVLGPRDRNALPRMLAVLRSPLRCLIGGGDNRVPVCGVEEVAEALVRAAEQEVAVGRAYNLSNREAVTQAQLMGLVAAEAGLPGPRLSVPLQVALPAIGLLEGLSRLCRRGEPFVTRLLAMCFGHDFQIDSAQAAADLGWRGEADPCSAVRRALGRAAAG